MPELSAYFGLTRADIGSMCVVELQPYLDAVVPERERRARADETNQWQTAWIKAQAKQK